MTRRGRIALKVGAWAACLLPLGFLVQRAVTGDLGANPISFVTNWLGDWTLRILLTSLAVTPLRIVFGLSWPLSLRRLLGLFALFYASLHFGVWIALDHYFDWEEMGADIVKRPYITVGVSALILMLPLAATSTTCRDQASRRPKLAASAPARICDRRLRRPALPLAGEEGQSRSVLLRGDPGGIAGDPRLGVGAPPRGALQGWRARCSVERARRLTSSPLTTWGPASATFEACSTDSTRTRGPSYPALPRSRGSLP